MNRTLWINRGAAVGAVVLAGVALTSSLAIGRALSAVGEARGDAPTSALKPATHPLPATARPALRRNGASARIAIGEHLNGQLGELGLNIVSVETPTVRPLGGGLHLAEVRVQARGDAAASAAAANWVAVNRETVRLKSLTIGLGPDQEGLCTLVLLMVIA
ncbi:hypothetical protein BrevBR_15450 [Brevundimonas sp. BR2-1]|uniref:hypothetical protein n=1 Tax=Brevundimonas sp. BR2-1 TaxID=3031123 RepID=UPI0030A5E091